MTLTMLARLRSCAETPRSCACTLVVHCVVPPFGHIAHRFQLIDESAKGVRSLHLIFTLYSASVRLCTGRQHWQACPSIIDIITVGTLTFSGLVVLECPSSRKALTTRSWYVGEMAHGFMDAFEQRFGLPSARKSLACA